MQYDTYGESKKGAALGELTNRQAQQMPAAYHQIPIKRQHSSNRIFGDENDAAVPEQADLQKPGKKQYVNR